MVFDALFPVCYILDLNSRMCFTIVARYNLVGLYFGKRLLYNEYLIAHH